MPRSMKSGVCWSGSSLDLDDQLTHCEDCGCEFDHPVPVEQALKDFPDLETAGYVCDRCEAYYR